MLGKPKLLAIMEPPTVNTGFGTVAKAIIPALAKEFEIHLLAAGGYGDKCVTSELFEGYGVDQVIITGKDNVHGIPLIDPLLNNLNPKVIFSYYDVGSVWEYMYNTFVSVFPHACYLITEGEPFLNSWKRMFDDYCFTAKTSAKNLTIDQIILSSEYATDVAKEQTGRVCPYAYHGADHANFRQLPKMDIIAFKKELGRQLERDLTNTFLIGYVARNAGRKKWPRLFRALKKVKDRLKEEGSDKKFLLLGHTKPFDDWKHDGWLLPEEVVHAGLDGEDVFFGTVEDIGGMVFDSDTYYSMVKQYNLLDLYVHPAAIEGCGLPMLEAARCGVPVLTTEWAAGWEYAKPFAMPIKVLDYDEHSVGLRQALVDIDDLADKIYKFIINPALCAEYSNRSLKYCDYTWKDLQEKSVKAAFAAMER